MTDMIGRGTCVECPGSKNGRPRPLECVHRSRYDHNIPRECTCAAGVQTRRAQATHILRVPFLKTRRTA